MSKYLITLRLNFFICEVAVTPSFLQADSEEWGYAANWTVLTVSTRGTSGTDPEAVAGEAAVMGQCTTGDSEFKMLHGHLEQKCQISL